MRLLIKKLSARSFGKLKDINIEFTKGMNVIYGPNESGKSTIQTFIKGMFYGLNKKTKKEELSEFDKYQPWNGTEYAGVIEYEEDGFFYRVGRNFLTNKVSVCNEFWDDITDKFPVDKKKGSLFAEKHIGLSERCFEQTMFIRQLETKIKDDTKEVLDRLINLQETGQEDVSLKKAQEVLNDAIKNIGNERTTKKPLNMADMQIENLKKEKNEVSILRNEVFRIQEEIKEKREKKQELSEQIENFKNIKQIIKKDNLLELYNKAKDYETHIENIDNDINRLKVFSNFPIHLEGRLKELLLEIRNYQTSLSNKNNQLEDINTKIDRSTNTKVIQNNDVLYSVISEFEIIKQTKNKLSELMIDFEKTAVSINKDGVNLSINADKLVLSEYKNKLKIYQTEIDNINQEIDKNSVLSDELKDYGKLKDVNEIIKKQYRNSGLPNKMFSSKSRKSRKRSIGLLFTIILSLGLLGVGVFYPKIETLSTVFTFLGLIGAAISTLVLIYNFYLERVKDAKNFSIYQEPKELTQMYKIVGVDSFENFVKGWYEYKDTSNKLSSLKVQLQEKINCIEDLKNEMSRKNVIDINDNNLKQDNILQTNELVIKLNQRIEDSEGKIKLVLDRYGVQYGKEIQEEHINHLKQEFENLFKVSSEVLGLKTVKENLALELSEIEDTLIALEKEKKEILDISDTQDEDEFLEGCKKSKNVKELLTEKGRLCKTYEELLKGENSENILKKVSSINNSKTVDVSNIEMEHVEVNLDKLKEELRNIEEEILNLQNEAENKLRGKMELNKIDEQIISLSEEKIRLGSERDSLEVALDILKESSKEIQRDFSPKFQKEVSQIINIITDGKYSEARTNENLNINVVDPKTGQIVEVDKLSSGTIEQFYLSLRIALSNVLSEGKERLPLIIDEAFVQYDDGRIRNVIEFLYKLSNERQIIVFTCQNRELDILKELGLMKKVNIIEL